MLYQSIKNIFRHEHTNTDYDTYISEFVYGGIDGTITTFVIISGATGAGLGLSVIIILGLGNLIADGLSMGMAGFFSRRSERDIMRKKIQGGTSNGHSDSGKCSGFVGLITFGSFVVIGSVPLAVYLLSLIMDIEHINLFLISSVGTILSLSIIGAVKSIVTNRNIIMGIVETLFLCGLAATVAYLIGFSLDRFVI